MAKTAVLTAVSDFDSQRKSRVKRGLGPSPSPSSSKMTYDKPTLLFGLEGNTSRANQRARVCVRRGTTYLLAATDSCRSMFYGAPLIPFDCPTITTPTFVALLLHFTYSRRRLHGLSLDPDVSPMRLQRLAHGLLDRGSCSRYRATCLLRAQNGIGNRCEDPAGMDVPCMELGLILGIE
jgi:hypothetical protein